MLPNFLKTATDRLQPDGAADSARCMGLCAHNTCRSTMPACELARMILSKFEPLADIMSGERFTKLFGKLRPKLKVALEKAGEIFLQNKTVPGFKRG